ncbi:MAG: TolC family protein [Oligoflexales bacterium]|nr:TolC family protein [Oligoflexales bacterium]
MIANSIYLLIIVVSIFVETSFASNENALLLNKIKELPEVKEFEYQISIATYEQRQTYSQWGPKVNLSSELWKDGHPENQNAQKNTNLSINLDLTLQNLLAGEIHRKNAQIERARLRYLQQLQETYFTVLSVMLRLDLFKEEANYLQNQESLAKKWQELYEQRYKSGYVDQISKLRWEIAYDEHKTRQVDIGISIHILESYLNSRSLREVPYEKKWGELDYIISQINQNKSSASFNVLIAEKDIEIAEQQHFAAKLALAPNLFTSLNYGKQHDSIANLLSSKEDYLEMVFGLQWQIFESGSNYYDIKNKKLNVQQSESRSQMETQNWQNSNERTQKSLVLLFDKLKTLESISNSYEKIVAKQEQLFKQGKADADQFKRDFDNFIFAKRSYLSSKRQFIEEFFNFYKLFPNLLSSTPSEPL